MSTKSFSDIFLPKFLETKKAEEKKKETSTERLQQRINEAHRKFKETKNECYLRDVEMLEKILDASEAVKKGKIDINKKAA